MNKYLKSKNKLTIDYFRALVAVAMADGQLKDEEIEFFYIKAKELGFSIDSIKQMASVDIDTLLNESKSSIDDVDFLTDIVAMAMVDGELHQKEYDLCINLAKRKGYNKSDIDETIKLLNEFINKNIKGNEN